MAFARNQAIAARMVPGFRNPFRPLAAPARERERARARRTHAFAPDWLESRFSPSSPGDVIQLASANLPPVNGGPKIVDLSKPLTGPSGPA